MIKKWFGLHLEEDFGVSFKQEDDKNMIKLNLGCGYKVMEGYENYDIYPLKDKVNYIDLEKLPLPFSDNYADEILLKEVLEHLWLNPHKFMLEIHRILKVGGTVTIEMPVFASCVEHVRFFHTKRYFHILTSSSELHPQNRKLFDQISCKYKFVGWFGVLPRMHIEWVLKKV